MIDDKLNEIFDIEPIDNKSELVVAEDKPNEDIELVKKVHHDLLVKSQDALETLIEFAKASESPRAYEVVANLIKTTADVAKGLSDIVSKETKSKPETQNNTQNNLFFGSTADLQKLLKGNQEDV
jgi:hypothetical protein